MGRAHTGIGNASITFLVVTRAEIDQMVAIADEALTEVETRFAGEIEEAE